MQQQLGQSNNTFLFEIHYVWDQLASSEPNWANPSDAEEFSQYRDQQHLIPFLMALIDEFEPVRASLLHRTPLPTLEQAVAELLLEETCLASRKTTPTNTVTSTATI